MSAERPAAGPGLRRRLSLFIGAGVLLTALVLALAAAGAVRAFMHEHVAERLAHDRDTLVAATVVDAEGRIDLADGAMGVVYGRPLSGHYYQVSVNGRTLRSRSLWDAELEVTAMAPGERRLASEPGPDGQRLLALSSGVIRNGVPFTVTVAEDIGGMQSALARLYVGLGTGALAVAAGLIVLLGLMLRSTLRPLQRLQGEINRLERGEIRSLDVRGVPREVAPLVEEVNRLLQLLFQRLTRSRHALGNLAHALKTPLAAIGQMPGEPALRADPELAARLRRHVERMRRTLEGELRRARLVGAAYAPGQAALASVVEDLLDTLARVHRGRNIRAGASIPQEARIRMDREDLTELLGVVLDNAFKWAASRVEVSFAEDQALSRVRVEDDGHGVAEQAMGELTGRGFRVDESREGSGLGLAIAREIAAHYGGELHFARSPALGGLCVELRLPRRGAPHQGHPADGDQSSSSSSRS